MSVLIFILILSFLVIIHEFGHFFAAKWAKVKVEEFGLGYPPQARKLFRWLDTEFTLNWVPFGGFVKMRGEELGESPKPETGDFSAAALWKRQVIILAGATTNFIFGILAFALVFSFMGIPTPLDEARIGQVMPETPVAEAGVPENVSIVGFKLPVEDEAEAAESEVIWVENSQAVVNFVEDNRGQTVTMLTTGQCEGRTCQEILLEHEVYVRTPEETPAGQGALGIIFQPVVFEFYPWYEMPFRSAWYGTQQAVVFGMLIVNALGDLVRDLVTTGAVPAEIAGPVGIVHQATQSGIFAEGWLMILSFAGMLSINLAIMNVLPIPPLDGGRAVFLALEMFVHRKKLLMLEHYLNYGGYILLLGLIILVTIRDVVRVFT